MSEPTSQLMDFEQASFKLVLINLQVTRYLFSTAISFLNYRSLKKKKLMLSIS